MGTWFPWTVLDELPLLPLRITSEGMVGRGPRNSPDTHERIDLVTLYILLFFSWLLLWKWLFRPNPLPVPVLLSGRQFICTNMSAGIQSDDKRRKPNIGTRLLSHLPSWFLWQRSATFELYHLSTRLLLPERHPRSVRKRVSQGLLLSQGLCGTCK